MDKELLEILACPKCKSGVEWEDDKIICRHCKVYYPVREGIPVMLVEEAKDYKRKTKNYLIF